MHPEIARQIMWQDRQVRDLTAARHHRSTRRRFPRRPAATEAR
jgi:hypothetical protein